uniref:Uncharacterized protein K02A2.6-like n=1 Tax=Nicotiana sylvestris TaxID=4096 RepID=A0A1U7XJZ2_NICSY|nr:PREDICTED: uncharacterized protein K02A2.6-like [Nicotiana sylvestris]
MKAQALADHLAENTVDDEYQPLSTHFSNEEVNSVEVIPEDRNAWKIVGAVNAKGVGNGAILILPTVTFKAVTKKVVVDFVHSNIICHFGIPKTIITDNTTNLNSHMMREVCKQFKLTYRNSTPYRPKANGDVKAANNNIKKILRKMIQSSRQWHKKLPFALLGYCTTVRTLVGPHTSYWFMALKP